MIITQNTTRNKFDRATFCTLHTQLKFAELKTRKINSFCYIVVYIESYSVEDVCIEMCVVCSVFFVISLTSSPDFSIYFMFLFSVSLSLTFTVCV